MGDWLIFKLKEGAQAGTELDESALHYLDKKSSAAAEKAARGALGKAKVELTAGETGVRLADPDMAQLQSVAQAVEKVVGPVGIAEVKTNEWWDRDQFAKVRAPIG